MASKIDKETQKLVEVELRKGSSNTRIAKLLDKPYDDAVKLINEIKESIRPEVGEIIKFSFRNEPMQGRIEKLLTNSAVVLIDWDNSSRKMIDLLEERTIVNFKDIEEFVSE